MKWKFISYSLYHLIPKVSILHVIIKCCVFTYNSVEMERKSCSLRDGIMLILLTSQVNKQQIGEKCVLCRVSFRKKICIDFIIGESCYKIKNFIRIHIWSCPGLLNLYMLVGLKVFQGSLHRWSNFRKKIMNGYPIFTAQIIYHQVDQIQK